MGSTPTPLKAGDPPSKALQNYRMKYGGRAQLVALLELIVNSRMDLGAIIYVLKHRAPRELDEIENALLAQLGDVENAVAHLRRMQHYRAMPVTVNEQGYHGDVPGSQGAELAAVIRAGADR